MRKSIAEIARNAQRLAAEMREALAAGSTDSGGAQQGSAHRRLPEKIRAGFIELRGALFDRGIYDPVLVRFDTATASQAETSKIADQLVAVSESLSAQATST